MLCCLEVKVNLIPSPEVTKHLDFSLAGAISGFMCCWCLIRTGPYLA